MVTREWVDVFWIGVLAFSAGIGWELGRAVLGSTAKVLARRLGVKE